MEQGASSSTAAAAHQIHTGVSFVQSPQPLRFAKAIAALLRVAAEACIGVFTAVSARGSQQLSQDVVHLSAAERLICVR